jgi:hypothetical protein
MNLKKTNQKFAPGQTAMHRRQRLSILLALIILFSLTIPVVQPASAQTEISPETVQSTWYTRVIDDPAYMTDMTDRSARFDVYGNPHVVYGGDHLYYARWDTSISGWIYRTIDYSPSVGRYASLALDNAGNPRVAYYDEANGALKFAYSQDRGYTWNPAFTVATFGPAPVTDADPENPTVEQALQPFTKFPVDPTSKLHETKSASPTAVEEIGVGGYTSIAVDGQNRVHVSYYDWSKHWLKYAIWDGVNWTIKTADPANENPPVTGYDVGKFSSIAIDQNGLAHISYLDEKYDVLKYAYDTGAGWENMEVESRQAPNVRTGGFTSLALDSSGNPYISYQDWQNQRLRFASTNSGSCSGSNCYACGPTGEWQCRIVDNSGATGFYTSLGRNGNGELMLAYRNATDGALEYAESSNGRSWSFATLVTSGDAGWFNSLAIDGSNYPGVSYYSSSTGLLAFIRYNGSGWVNSGIRYAADLGPYSSLAIGTFNAPSITYFNDIGDQLKLVNSLGPTKNWTQIVTTGGGSYSSLKLTKSGEPRIAFYDFANYNLVYAYLSGGSWYFTTVDATGDVGMYPSLALDDQNHAYISYYDATYKQLKFAWWNGSTWTVQIADTSLSADLGMYNSLTISKNTLASCYAWLSTGYCPMISYYDATNKALKHAFLSSIGAWVAQTVDGAPVGNTADVGQYSSIDIDYNGQMHISYYDATNGWLKHALGTKGASQWAWTTEVVDNVGNVGKYTSLISDKASNIHVSYYDVTNGALKYAKRVGATWYKETVDNSADTGVGTSIALFTDGQPGISYYDATNGAIMFTTTYNGFYGRPYFLPSIQRNY